MILEVVNKSWLCNLFLIPFCIDLFTGKLIQTPGLANWELKMISDSIHSRGLQILFMVQYIPDFAARF